MGPVPAARPRLPPRARRPRFVERLLLPANRGECGALDVRPADSRRPAHRAADVHAGLLSGRDCDRVSQRPRGLPRSGARRNQLHLGRRFCGSAAALAYEAGCARPHFRRDLLPGKIVATAATGRAGQRAEFSFSRLHAESGRAGVSLRDRRPRCLRNDSRARRRQRDCPAFSGQPGQAGALGELGGAARRRCGCARRGARWQHVLFPVARGRRIHDRDSAENRRSDPVRSITIFGLALCRTRWIACALALSIAASSFAAPAQTGRISGRVHKADSDAPVARAQVRVEGPTLVGRENSQIIQKVKSDGLYQVDVPPGAYDVWVTAPDFEEVKAHVELTAGAGLVRNFELRALQLSPYRVETLRLPQQMIGEVSGVAFTPKGSLVVTNRRGDVWIRGYKDGGWHRFASGVYEGFGLVANNESDIVVIQRPEITRLRDTDGDGIADVYETIADDWGITGSYHEFSYGLARDTAGNFYASSGLCSFGRGVELPWVRGPLQTAQFMPWTGTGPVPDGHRSVAQYQGWVFQITPDGKWIPFASGFRQPLGVGVSPRDELFISDCPGAWVPTSTLTHVEQGGFYGHPDSLKWHPEYKDRKMSIEQLAQLRRPPSIYLPRGLMGTSPGQPIWDRSGGKFGPFEGQVFLGDVSSLLMRVDLEKVAGAYQGAAFPFLRGQGLRIGGMHNAFGPDGALYIGQTVRGWMSTEGNEGIQRVLWTGETPTEIQTLRLTDKGFALRFTEAMGLAAGEARNYQVRRFQYNYHPQDGSLRINQVDVPIAVARFEPDGRSLELELVELQPGYIYEFVISRNVTSRKGSPLLNLTAYYTLNRLKSGETKPGPSRLVVRAPEPLRAGDPVRGAEVYRLNCLVCHLADGKGSVQVGTPDYTMRGGPLSKSDDELIAVITEGKLPTPPGVLAMPPWGNVLQPQAIRDVVAYLREAFQKSPP
ncbi:MAG: c-type cytochrome [Opitutus sp.]|nr:c-type cytochrome [Opitutus sp.]